MLTFPPPALKGIHLIPLNAESTAGRFRVWLSTDNDPKLVWDRKLEGRFPELKEVVGYLRHLSRLCAYKLKSRMYRNNGYETPFNQACLWGIPINSDTLICAKHLYFNRVNMDETCAYY